MEKAQPRWRWVRGAAASAIIFLFLAILIPNLRDLKELAGWIGVLIVPLTCIHFGTVRLRFLEIAGWVLLAGLLGMAISA